MKDWEYEQFKEQYFKRFEVEKYFDSLVSKYGLTEETLKNCVEYIKDSEKKLKEFLSTLPSIKKIDILPYHNMGKFKWENLGDIYELENTPIPTKEEIDRAKLILGI